MEKITAALVKELRERTGAGIINCKRALESTSGDLEAAIEWLRKEGSAISAKKVGRSTAEGVVCSYIEDRVGALIEINCETDFVARNDRFQQAVAELAKIAIKCNDLESLKNSTIDNSTVANKMEELISVLGENIVISRMAKISVDQGSVTSYVHNVLAPNIGRIAVLVGLESSAPKEKLEILGKQLAMHIVATNPQAINITDLPAEILEKEREIYKTQANSSGKPASVIDKVVEGKIRKFYEENILLEQGFVMDNKVKVSKLLEDFAKEYQCSVVVKNFVKFEVAK